MSAVRVTPYRDAHYEEVRALWLACFPNDPPRNRAEISIPAKLKVQRELFLVAMDGGEVVGTTMAGYDGHRGWLNQVAVAASHRRLGVARAMVEEAEARLRALGCIKINLQVRAGNDAAVAAYQAMGFEVEALMSMGKLLKAGDDAGR